MKHLLLTTIAAVVLVGCGNPEAVRALLKAATEGNIEGTKQLIADGADVNAKNRDGTTPLHTAAARGHKELVELLIANGADVNARRSKYGGGYTPLHYAARHMEIAALLIANGADVNVKMDGKTILDSAKYRNPKFADLLRKHGGKTGEELKAEGK